ncbi:MAG: hypothetical protein WCI52_02220 [bacterium]
MKPTVRILAYLLAFIVGFLIDSFVRDHLWKKEPAPSADYSSTSVVNEYPASTVVKIEQRRYISIEGMGEEEVFIVTDGLSYDVATVSNGSIPKDCKFLLRIYDTKTGTKKYMPCPGDETNTKS